MKNFFKAGFFVAIVIIGLRFSYSILSWKDASEAGMPAIYKLENNSVNVMFYGSSHCWHTINNAILWQNYDIASFNAATPGQGLGNTYYCIQESLKTQDPDIIAVELLATAWKMPSFKDGNFYRNTLNFKWSKLYLDNLEYTSYIAEVDQDTKESALLKFPVIHTRYREIRKKDFDQDFYLKGSYAINWSSEAYDVSEIYHSNEIQILREDDRMYLEKIVELAKKKDKELIFFVAPYIMREGDESYFNAAEQFALEHNIPFLNFNKLIDDIQLDFSCDMADEKHAGSHLNAYGMKKVTNYIGKYINDNYKLSNIDIKGKEYYTKISEYWEHSVQNHEMAQVLDPLLYGEIVKKRMDEDKYIVAFNFNHNSVDNEFLCQFLSNLGISQEEIQYSGAWLFSNGELEYYTEGNNDYLYYEKVGDSYLAIKNEENNMQILVDNNKYVKAPYGINILIYDLATDSVADMVGITVAGTLVR